MPTLLDHFSPRQKNRRPLPPSWLLATGLVLCLVLVLAIPAFTEDAAPAPTPTPSPTLPAIPSKTPPAVTPTPTPTPKPVPAYDFAAPAPECEAVGADYFADAVFIGDSRTDGLKLFGGIEGADFLEHTGITVFEVGTKQVIRIDGAKYTVLEALAMKQYGKVYLMLGVNELGYYDDAGFAQEYAALVDNIRALQPGAIIYLQNLVSIHPEKAKANNQPAYVTNEQIAVYNQIITDIAAEKQAVLVDVNAALVGEDGILPREGTTDGVHFTKGYYVKWYDWLKTHTVAAESYWAGQAAQ